MAERGGDPWSQAWQFYWQQEMDRSGDPDAAKRFADDKMNGVQSGPPGDTRSSELTDQGHPGPMGTWIPDYGTAPQLMTPSIQTPQYYGGVAPVFAGPDPSGPGYTEGRYNPLATDPTTAFTEYDRTTTPWHPTTGETTDLTTNGATGDGTQAAAALAQAEPPPGVDYPSYQGSLAGIPVEAGGISGIPTGMPNTELGASMVGGDPWLNSLGTTFIGTHPALESDHGNFNNLPLYLDLYAKQNHLSDWWGAEVQPQAESLYGLYQLNHPGQRLTPVQQANLLGSLAPGGELNTPGQYLDVGSTWDKFLQSGTGEPGAPDLPGQGPGMDVGSLAPEDQITAVNGALGTLAPYIGQENYAALQQSISAYAIKWMEEVNDPNNPNPVDFLRYLEAHGAAGWM